MRMVASHVRLSARLPSVVPVVHLPAFAYGCFAFQGELLALVPAFVCIRGLRLRVTGGQATPNTAAAWWQVIEETGLAFSICWYTIRTEHGERRCSLTVTTLSRAIAQTHAKALGASGENS
jgi:hypothetical protein